LARSKWKFSIALSDTKDGTGFPTTGTIDIQSALADLKAVRYANLVRLKIRIPMIDRLRAILLSTCLPTFLTTLITISIPSTPCT
jgi:hypothetical protein